MAEDWSSEEVGQWLRENGFGEYTELLCDQHKIDGQSLLTLSQDDLKGPLLDIQILGDIKRLGLAIHKLQLESESSSTDLCLTYNCVDHSLCSNGKSRRYIRQRSSMSTWSEEGDPQDAFDTKEHADGSSIRPYTDLDPELWKTALSFVYVFGVFLLTSIVMVIVHDRVPDMQKYPPLPDLFLDNVPLIPGAFEMCEFTIAILGVIWCIILVFHKHRFILLRRFFSLMGTVFLLRCVTMFITSLSVPGIHLNCKPRENTDFSSQFWRAIEIWRGLGMALQGVRSCGDYMYSGHTVCLTLTNFFITEYTPRRLYYLHTLSWVLNLFGIFFILAAHEHYSLDVFIAFYISSRLFLYYHTLANNRAGLKRDCKRTWMYYPLFSFFESKCTGIVPTEYEWPLPWPRSCKKYFENHKKII